MRVVEACENENKSAKTIDYPVEIFARIPINHTHVRFVCLMNYMATTNNQYEIHERSKLIEIMHMTRYFLFFSFCCDSEAHSARNHHCLSVLFGVHHIQSYHSAVPFNSTVTQSLRRRLVIPNQNSMRAFRTISMVKSKPKPISPGALVSQTHALLCVCPFNEYEYVS